MHHSNDNKSESRAQQRLLARETQLTSLRKARRERIRAGKADAFDCSSEEDVVCPHCGAWFDGELELGEVIARWRSERSPREWHRVPCQECELYFDLKVVVQLRFTTTSPR